jgi:hypothetical protein
VRGPGMGASWTAATVNAFIRTPLVGFGQASP